MALPIAWLLAHHIARHLQSLVGEAARIRHFQFQDSVEVRSIITEVNQLAEAIALMKSTIRRFLDISTALAAEQNFPRLLDRVLAETLALTQAEAGLLLLVSDDERTLQPAAARLSDEAALVAANELGALSLTDSCWPPLSTPRVPTPAATAPGCRN